VRLIATVHRTAHTTTVWTASAALETTGSDVTVGWIVRRYLPDTKIRNRPKSIHPPFKMGVSVAQSKFQISVLFCHNPDRRLGRDRSGCFDLHHAVPTDVQSGVYSSVLYYLRLVRTVGADNAPAVMVNMQETPISDVLARNGTLKQDVHGARHVPGQGEAPKRIQWALGLVRIVRTLPGAGPSE
jgi:hypothetical protein